MTMYIYNCVYTLHTYIYICCMYELSKHKTCSSKQLFSRNINGFLQWIHLKVNIGRSGRRNSSNRRNMINHHYEQPPQTILAHVIWPRHPFESSTSYHDNKSSLGFNKPLISPDQWLIVANRPLMDPCYWGSGLERLLKSPLFIPTIHSHYSFPICIYMV